MIMFRSNDITEHTVALEQDGRKDGHAEGRQEGPAEEVDAGYSGNMSATDSTPLNSLSVLTGSEVSGRVTVTSIFTPYS